MYVSTEKGAPVFKFVRLKPLAIHCCGFESRKGLWVLSCEEAIQLAYRMSVLLLRWLFVSELMHGGAPRGLPPPVKLKSSLMIYMFISNHWPS
jgi:hypothetical protein